MAAENAVTSIEDIRLVEPENSPKPRRFLRRVMGAVAERASYGRRIGLSVLGGLALVGAVPEVASAWNSDSRSSAVDIAAVTGLAGGQIAEAKPKPAKPEAAAHQFKLQKIEQLPGNQLKVSPELREKLRASTLRFMIKGSDSVNASYTPHCTAVKISENVAITDGHCVAMVTKEEPLSAWDFALVDPMVEDTNGIPQLLNDTGVKANVDGIARGMYDVALLHVDTSVKNKIEGIPTGQSFSDVPALNAEFATDVLVSGEQVALYGLPSANLDKPYEDTGWIVGSTGELIWVAIKKPPAGEPNITCTAGFSGSMGILADGRIIGPLSYVSNNVTNYDPDLVKNVGKEFRVDLTGYDLCAFNKVDEKGLSDLRNKLNTPAQKPY